MVNSNLKIHIQTGNIYYNDKDKNQSVLDFILNQQNPITGYVNFDFTYGDSYENYFNWLINSFDNYQKIKLHVLKF